MMHPTLVVATHNAGKLAEWRRLLAPLPFVLRSADELGLGSPDESGASYLDNAAIKALAAARATGELAIADDTGLEIEMLGGAPGLRTAPWVEEHGGWDEAYVELARRTGLHDGVRVRATLVCAVVVADARGVDLRSEARVGGLLVWPPTDAPGAAAIFAPEDRAVIEDGVLVHRRAAFDRVVSRLRVTSSSR